MSNGTTPVPAAWSSTHVLGVAAGAVVGGLILAPVVAAALPLAGLGAVAALMVPGSMGLVGAYIGHVFTKPA